MKRLIKTLCVSIYLLSCNDASFEGGSTKKGVKQSSEENPNGIESNDAATAPPSEIAEEKSGLQPKFDNSSPTRTITYWKSKDYTCVNKRGIVETLSIEKQGDLLVARKIKGDECIGDNEISWKARYSYETGIGQGIIYGRFPGTTQIIETAMTIKIVSNSHIQLIIQGQGTIKETLD